MTTWQTKAATYLARMRAAHASETVTYRRGVLSVELSASPVPDIYEANREGGATVQAQRMDWIIPAASLILGGSVVEPQAGDRIEWINGETTETYELQPVDAEEAASRLDANKTQYLAHSRLVDEA